MQTFAVGGAHSTSMRASTTRSGLAPSPDARTTGAASSTYGAATLMRPTPFQTSCISPSSASPSALGDVDAMSEDEARLSPPAAARGDEAHAHTHAPSHSHTHPRASISSILISLSSPSSVGIGTKRSSPSVIVGASSPTRAAKRLQRDDQHTHLHTTHADDAHADLNTAAAPHTASHQSAAPQQYAPITPHASRAHDPPAVGGLTRVGHAYAAMHPPASRPSTSMPHQQSTTYAPHLSSSAMQREYEALADSRVEGAQRQRDLASHHMRVEHERQRREDENKHAQECADMRQRIDSQQLEIQHLRETLHATEATSGAHGEPIVERHAREETLLQTRINEQQSEIDRLQGIVRASEECTAAAAAAAVAVDIFTPQLATLLAEHERLKAKCEASETAPPPSEATAAQQADESHSSEQESKTALSAAAAATAAAAHAEQTALVDSLRREVTDATTTRRNLKVTIAGLEHARIEVEQETDAVREQLAASETRATSALAESDRLRGANATLEADFLRAKKKIAQWKAHLKQQQVKHDAVIQEWRAKAEAALSAVPAAPSASAPTVKSPSYHLEQLLADDNGEIQTPRQL
jgi:hypothetical protein